MWPFRSHGILGQNARNLLYIKEFNSDISKRLADSKIKTKEFLSKKGVNVAQTLAIIRSHKELKHFDIASLVPPFVVKPNKGYGGKGILVIDEKNAEGNFLTSDGELYTPEKLIRHIEDILDGFYSLSGYRDRVLFERKLVLDQSIALLGKYGLPDIRIIVFNMVPVIAMMRVPTANSKGKANLHMGACGLGIDIGSGKITYITQKDKIIKSIPGIGDVRGIELPHWEDVLKLAAKVQQITQVGYVGCDIVLDDILGPLLLEMNVRPGLGVQIANKIPLLSRLKRVEDVEVTSVVKGVRLARDLFGGDIEEKIKSISGKKVIGNREYIEIEYDKKTYQILTETKANKPNSYINTDYLLGTLKYPESKIKDGKVKLKCDILGEKRNIWFHVKPLEVSNIILGKQALYGFLIDPFKYRENDLPFNVKNPLLKERNVVILKGYEEQLIKIDKELMDVDKKLNILKCITPLNVESERLKFVESEGKYIPQLQYAPLKIDIDDLKSQLSKIEISDIPLGALFSRKKQEISYKLKFLGAFQEQDVKDMQKYIHKLFGNITPQGQEYTNTLLETHHLIKPEKIFLTFDEIKSFVEKFNHIYSLPLKVTSKIQGSRFSIKGNALHVLPTAQIGKKEIRSIVAHEIETHYLRKINGLRQKYEIFQRGTANYLQTEEGLAIYNQNGFINDTLGKYYGASKRYFLLDYASRSSYEDYISQLETFYPENWKAVFNYLVRSKRGIQDVSDKYLFTKDVIYINGLLEVEEFVENGGDLRELYFGKIGIQDLQEIKSSGMVSFKKDSFVIPLFY